MHLRLTYPLWGVCTIQLLVRSAGGYPASAVHYQDTRSAFNNVRCTCHIHLPVQLPIPEAADDTSLVCCMLDAARLIQRHTQQ